MRSIVRVGSVALALIATAVAWPATADPAAPRTTLADGPVGAIAFNSYTPASQRPLLTRGHLGGPVAVVGGTLSLPAPAADGRFPAVILAHGIGGISAEREGAWARRLNEWGIAAFILDSFTASCESAVQPARSINTSGSSARISLATASSSRCAT